VLFDRIFQPHPEQTIVIVSNAGGDSGTTITNCAEYLASQIVKEFAIDPAAIQPEPLHPLPCYRIPPHLRHTRIRSRNQIFDNANQPLRAPQVAQVKRQMIKPITRMDILS